MLFAVLMDSNLVKAKGVWKAVLYMPALTSVVISGTLFRLMFAEMPTGQMNQILQFFGSDAIPWLKNGTTAMFALILLCCWRWTGVNMLYFMSGLKGIDASLYEAADIDGANSWNLFRHITVPLVSPVTFYLLITGLIGGFQVFVEVLVMVPTGGLDYSAATVVFYLYEKAFTSRQMGYGSAMAFLLSLIIFVITAINFKAQDKWVKTMD